MANKNCLEGMQCPACGSAGPFKIAVLCWAIVHDDGVDSTSDHEWEKNSTCRCVACGDSGKVSSFSRKMKTRKELAHADGSEAGKGAG